MKKCRTVLRGGGKVLVHRGVQVSEDSLGDLKGGGRDRRQDCRIDKEQFEDDLKKVFNSILEVVAEVELENDASEKHSGEISVDRVQMCNRSLNKNLVHASSVKQASGEGVREMKCNKILTSGIQKGVSGDKYCHSVVSGGLMGNSEVRKKGYDFNGWDDIEELDDDSASGGESVECTDDDDDDSGEEMGFRSRYRFRGRTRLGEIGGDDAY
jgi:hypothetical protein